VEERATFHQPSRKEQTVNFQTSDLPLQHSVFGMLQGKSGSKNWSIWVFREGWRFLVEETLITTNPHGKTKQSIFRPHSP
jgi:hypothetical protein